MLFVSLGPSVLSVHQDHAPQPTAVSHLPAHPSLHTTQHENVTAWDCTPHAPALCLYPTGVDKETRANWMPECTNSTCTYV